MSTDFTTFLSAHPWILIPVAIWTLPWKGIALWRAARNRSAAWFIILLIVNTLGILEIIYIFFFSRKGIPPVKFERGEMNSREKRVLDIKNGMKY